MIQTVVFSLIPLCALIAVAETVLRLGGWGDSPITPYVLPGEPEGLVQLDEDLFWSLRPDQEVLFFGVPTRTNSLGLRGPEVRRRRDREFRILSLGESSAFGNGVGDAETYAALLEAHLNRAAGEDLFTVINGGVPAYTSFQSLVYLKERGLALEPQMLLFYHEANDLLPSYLRASDSSVVGMNLSDPERHADRLRRTHRRLLAWSAIYRFIRYRLALSQIEQFQQTVGEEFRPAWPVQVGEERRSLKFPFRVRLEERIEILKEFLRLSREHAFEFVLIHPSYRDSKPHSCVFTEFSRANRVPLFEVHPLLHPEDGPHHFLDAMHPTRRGHERIADALFNFLVEKRLVPLKRSSGQKAPGNA